MPEFEITLRGETWMLDLHMKTLTKKNDRSVVRHLNLEQLEHFTDTIKALYGYSALLRETKVF